MAENASEFLNEAILEEKLVDLWQYFLCLYDARSAEFRDRVKRDQAVHEMAEKLEQTSILYYILSPLVEQCQEKAISVCAL